MHIERNIKKLRTPVKSIPNHHCQLPLAPDPMVVYCSEGYCIPLKRKLLQLFVVSEDHFMTNYVFSSTLQIHVEKHRHLRYYSSTIHPFSKFRFYWEIWMAFVLIFSLIFFVLHYGMVLIISEKIDYTIGNIIQVIFLIDLIITFYTGYYDADKNGTVLNKKHIAWRYITSYFLFDLLALTPYNAIIEIFKIKTDRKYLPLEIVRILRLITWMKYIGNLNYILKWSGFYFDLFKMIVLSIVALMYFTWSLNEVKKFDPEFNVHYVNMTGTTGMLVNIYISIRLLFMIRPSIEYTYHLMIIQYVAINLANFFNAALIVMAFRVYNRSNLFRQKKISMERQITEYAISKELPEVIHKTMVQFINFKFSGTMYNEKLIMDSLSSQMKNELHIDYCLRLVQDVPLFRDSNFSELVQERIAQRLKQEIVLPNDVIVSAGSKTCSMYFLKVGVVAVYTGAGKEIAHLSNGTHFGEMSLLVEETRPASVVAVDFCEIFTLNRKDFLEAIEPFPDIQQKLEKISETEKIRMRKFVVAEKPE